MSISAANVIPHVATKETTNEVLRFQNVHQTVLQKREIAPFTNDRQRGGGGGGIKPGVPAARPGGSCWVGTTGGWLGLEPGVPAARPS